MKKLFAKLISSKNKPDLYLGFSGTSLKWVYSQGITDKNERTIIDDYGTIMNFEAVSTKLLPENFKKAIKSSKIHFVLPAGACVQSIIDEVISMNQVRDRAPGYVVHQTKLTENNKHTLYNTTSIHMEGIAPQLRVLAAKSIVPTEIHHASTGFLDAYDTLGGGASLIISLGEVFSWVAWISGKKVLYQEDLKIGRSDLLNTIKTVLDIDDIQAKKILDKYGVTKAHPDTIVLQALHQTLRPLSILINDWIRHHNGFTYIKQPYQGTPKITYIIGSASTLPGIEQYFVLQSGIAVENIGKKTLEKYRTQSEGHISDLYDYEPLVCMIKTGQD